MRLFELDFQFDTWLCYLAALWQLHDLIRDDYRWPAISKDPLLLLIQYNAADLESFVDPQGTGQQAYPMTLTCWNLSEGLSERLSSETLLPTRTTGSFGLIRKPRCSMKLWALSEEIPDSWKTHSAPAAATTFDTEKANASR